MICLRFYIYLFLLCFFTNTQGFAQWEAQNPGYPEDIGIIYSSVVNENVVWTVGGHEIDHTAYQGFSRTTDGGKTWQVDTIRIDGIETYRFTSIFALDDSVAWVSMIDDISFFNTGRIIKTIDGGNTWEHQSTAYTIINDLADQPAFVYFFDNNNGFSVGYYEETWTTSDGGNNWTLVEKENVPDRLTNEQAFGSNVWPLGDSTAWYGTSKGRVFKTTDKGHSWKAYNVGLGEATVFASFKDELNGLAVTPVINRNIAKTTDGGETWVALPNQLPINALLVYVRGTENTYMFGSGDLPLFIIGSDPGSGFTIDDGNTFIFENDMPLDPLLTINPFVGWAVGSTNDNYIYKWIGPSLDEIPDPKNFTELDIVYTPPGFSLGDFIATICIPKNPNGVGVVLAHGAYSSQGPFQRKTMKIWCDTLAANGYTAMTIDYYNIDNSIDEEIDSNAAYPEQATTLKHAVEFLRKNSERFKISTDKIVGFGMSAGAISWGQTITWENDDAFFDTDPSINDHVDAAVLLYGAYDWFLYDNANFNLIRDKHFINFPDHAATKGNAIVNVANINTPILMAHGTSDSNVPYQHSVNFHDSLLANGKSSRLLLYPGRTHVFELNNFFPPHNFTEDGLELKNHILAFLDTTVLNPSVSVIKEKRIATINKFSLSQNYPNPFNPVTTINYQLAKRSNVELTVYNILGKHIATLVSDKKTAGNHSVIFDTSNLASGIYFYTLKAGERILHKKMLLVK